MVRSGFKIHHILLAASTGEEAGFKRISASPPKKESIQKRFEINRILLMDDEDCVREVVKEMLKHLGYEVSTASCGSQAVAHYKDSFEAGQSYDLVISDLTVPGDFGGVELLKKLHEVDPEAKVIISSGYSNDPVLVQYKSYGFLDFIVKPYTVHELNIKLNQLNSVKR